MRWLIVVVVVVVAFCAAGCVAAPSVLRWKPDAGILAIYVPLGYAPEPVPWQRQRVDQIAIDRCGDNYQVVEEGADISSTPYFTMVGTTAAAGETTTRSYYWVVHCGAEKVSASEQASAAHGCVKDTDCKGDRVCDAGSCKEPVKAP